MLVNMPERLILLTSRYCKVIINTEETACSNTSKYITVYIDFSLDMNVGPKAYVQLSTTSPDIDVLYSGSMS
jgi:hypothetical protein